MNSQRKKLPERRYSEIVEINHMMSNGHIELYSGGVGYYDDGSIGEIFLDSEKQSSDISNLACDAALVLSIAIQYGIPIAELHASIGRDYNNKPLSIIGAALDVLMEREGNRK